MSVTEATAPKEHFTKVYPRGWSALSSMLENRPMARVYVFLADNCGHDNALVCTYDVICETLGLSERTIRRAIKDLEAGGHVVVFKIGTANAYVLNPAEVWKTVEEHKTFCAFNARTLVGKKSNPDFKKRFTHKLA